MTTNPVAIIVGAGPGVGAATARMFAAAGYDVGLIARDAQRVKALAEELGNTGAQVGYGAADTADTEQFGGLIQRMTAQTGRLDVLLYNPSVGREVRPSELTADVLLADLAVGTAGLLTAIQAALPVFREQRTGTVLVTGSVIGDRPSAAVATLGVQKAALRNLTQVLAADLGNDGIHVATVIVNGLIRSDTPLSAERIAEVYAELVEETASDPANWRTLVTLNSDGKLA